ncbi:hypothetical protein MMC19_003613 [Ptychographa xylographoides]|nr:hypothetical protein [Ptychographa xylographoides]
MLRTAKPKLSLAMPSMAAAHSAPRSPFPIPVSPSPINSPTARNTAMNQRGFCTAQQPTFAYAQSSSTKSILKRERTNSNSGSKKIQFKENPTITCVSPMPPGYHGEYIKMTRDERRWGAGRPS